MRRLAHSGAVTDQPAFAADFRSAPPLLLHPSSQRRTDSNSPLLRRAGETLTFVSHYLPIGHTMRCSTRGSWPDGSFAPIAYVDDPAPAVGKWIQSVWRAPDGGLFAWYHAEEKVPDAARLFLPHVGALRSDDEGRTWRLLGDLLRAPLGSADRFYRNGFVAGGYGDFSVIPDRDARWFYLHYTSYVADEAAQGIAVLRYPVASRERPSGLEVWREGAWRPHDPVLPGTPYFAVDRGWRHADPAAYWGPAVHFNRAISSYVMLLNRTEGGRGDIVQRGVFVSFNRDPADPAGWSPPQRIVMHGSWYPQAIGLQDGDGDTLAGEEARFFMSGYSAWTIRFRAGAPAPPLEVSREKFAELFGTGPW